MGAEKVEENVGRLKLKLRRVTDEARGRADARIGPAWETVQKQIETRKPLRKSELRGKRLLKRIIEGTIQELEKVNRKLEQNIKTCGYAA